MLEGLSFERPNAAYRRITADGCPGFPAADKVEVTMTVYSGPVFDMAVNQFGVIANHLRSRWTSATGS